MESMFYVLLWETGCLAMFSMGIFKLLRKKEKTGLFLIISSIALILAPFVSLMLLVSGKME